MKRISNCVLKMAMGLIIATFAVTQYSSPAAAQSGPGWITLFDGKSLDGWKANENPGSFQLRDGKLIVHGPRAHLFYVGPVANET